MSAMIASEAKTQYENCSLSKTPLKKVDVEFFANPKCSIIFFCSKAFAMSVHVFGGGGILIERRRNKVRSKVLKTTSVLSTSPLRTNNEKKKIN